METNNKDSYSNQPDSSSEDGQSIYRHDEPRREMARLPALAGIVTAIGVGSIFLLGLFLYFCSYMYLPPDLKKYGYVAGNIFLVPLLFFFLFKTADWGLQNEHKWGKGE